MNDDCFDDFFIEFDEYDSNYESPFYDLEMDLHDWVYLYLHLEYLITKDEGYELKYEDFGHYEPESCYTLSKDKEIIQIYMDKSTDKLTHAQFLNYLGII